MLIYLDFETRGTVDLRGNTPAGTPKGLARYVRDPKFDVLCFACANGDNPVFTWKKGMPIPLVRVPADAKIVAHNAQFELAVWNEYCVPKFGWPPLRPEQMICTLARCYAMALPGALENAAPALGIAVEKDKEGKALMMKMCKPRADGTWIEDAASLDRLAQYCAQDVVVEREIYKRTLSLTPTEQRVWEVDQRINARGIPFDLPAVRGMLKLVDAEKERLNLRMDGITDGECATATNVGSLKDFCADFGVMPEGMAKEYVSELLKLDLPQPVREALEIRQQASRFTSLAKLNAILDREVLGRVMYTLAYHAASTGRWAARGIQPQNFTRDLPDPVTVETVMRAARDGDAGIIEMFGPLTEMLSRCLRGLIAVEEGELFGGDYSAIEGRGAAWLANEKWKLEAFLACDRDPALPDIYERTAAKILGKKPDTISSVERQAYGKVPELALGYQGGVGALQSMAKSLGVSLSDEQWDKIKTEWRAAHPNYPLMWKAYHKAAIVATERAEGSETNQVKFKRRGSFLFAQLPSGRVLTYPYPEVREDDFGPHLTFKTVPNPIEWAIYAAAKRDGTLNTSRIVDDPGNCKQWARIKTYGGMLTENFDQAICRDILAEALVRMEDSNLPVVLHVHDDIIVHSTPERFDEFVATLAVQPIWAPDFPIAAKCWHAKRITKD